MYAFFFLALLSVGLVFLYFIHKDHNAFFTAYKCQMISAIFLLTVPLVIRCVLDYTMNHSDNFSNYVNANLTRITTYNIIFFTTTTYSLIVSQCVTLVFGLIRANQIKQINSSRSHSKSNREYLPSGHVSNEINNTGSFEQTNEDNVDTRTVSSGSSGDDDLSNNGEDYFAPPI